MKAIGRMSELELAAYISSHLRKKDIDVVLSGGACVSIYSFGQYVSMDLDLVNALFAKRSRLRAAMEEIGFKEQNRYFRHPDSDYLVEFPAGPLAVGDEPVKKIEERHVATGMVRMLSPSDCVKDRLTWFYHNDDRQCLAQAHLVVQMNDVDLDEIERWSKAEGKYEEYKDIRESLIKDHN